MKQIEHIREQLEAGTEHPYCLIKADDDPRRVIIDFSNNLRILPASTLLSQNDNPRWDEHGEYRKSVVIIGGSFHQGDDMRETPVGLRSGLQINGLALATLLNKDKRRLKYELTEPQTILIDLALALILVLCAALSRALALCATIGFLVASFFWSRFLFPYGLFLSFLPIAFGALLQGFEDGPGSGTIGAGSMDEGRRWFEVRRSRAGSSRPR